MNKESVCLMVFIVSQKFVKTLDLKRDFDVAV